MALLGIRRPRRVTARGVDTGNRAQARCPRHYGLVRGRCRAGAGLPMPPMTTPAHVSSTRAAGPRSISCCACRHLLRRCWSSSGRCQRGWPAGAGQRSGVAALAADDRLQLFPLLQLRAPPARGDGCYSVRRPEWRLQGRADCRRTRAALLPDADHRRWHRAAGQGAGIGAGVAGLQAIATRAAPRCTGEGFDVRPENPRADPVTGCALPRPWRERGR